MQELLGHASLVTTARYVVVDRAALHRAVAALERALARNGSEGASFTDASNGSRRVGS